MTDHPANPAELLDAVERADAHGDHTTALTLLKAGAERFADNADVAYRLGAEFAHLELFDAAESQMQRALDIDAGHATARFHLGFLQLSRSRYPEALATWQALDTLPEDHALRLYKQAFEVLAKDRYAPARELLSRGLAARGSTDALNREMEKLLASIPPETGAA